MKNPGDKNRRKSVGSSRRDFIKQSAFVIGSSALPAGLLSVDNRAVAQTVNPLTLPLVTANTPLFTYLGSFQGPKDVKTSDGSFDFSYSAGAMSVANSTATSLGNLYASGLEQGDVPSLGLMQIPAPTGPNGTYAGTELASTVFAPKQIPNSVGINVATGSLAYNNKLYVTGALGYNADSASRQSKFLFPMNTDMTNQGAPCAANGDAGDINRMFSNYMGLVPAIWQPYLGGPAFIAGGPGGESGLSIISEQCCGYGFSTFNPDSVVAGQPVAIREWINWPYDTQGTGRSNHVSALWPAGVFTQPNWESTNPGNNYVSEYDRPIGCAFIPDGSRSLIFIHWHAYGPQSGAGTSPCSGGASGSYETPLAPDTSPYTRMQVVAFDLAQVINSRNNGGSITAVLPYAWWEFPNWQSIIGKSSECPLNGSWQANAWAAYDPVRRSNGMHRMYWNADFSSSNGTVYVFDVAGIGPSSSTPNPPTNFQVV